MDSVTFVLNTLFPIMAIIIWFMFNAIQQHHENVHPCLYTCNLGASVV